jgi:hypothetical protein
MDRWDLVKKSGQWYQEGDGKRVARGPRKEQAIQKTARAASRARQPVTLKIHKASGPIDEERTYPRGADPRKSKG